MIITYFYSPVTGFSDPVIFHMNSDKWAQGFPKASLTLGSKLLHVQYSLGRGGEHIQRPLGIAIWITAAWYSRANSTHIFAVKKGKGK